MYAPDEVRALKPLEQMKPLLISTCWPPYRYAAGMASADVRSIATRSPYERALCRNARVCWLSAPAVVVTTTVLSRTSTYQPWTAPAPCSRENLSRCWWTDPRSRDEYDTCCGLAVVERTSCADAASVTVTTSAPERAMYAPPV